MTFRAMASLLLKLAALTLLLAVCFSLGSMVMATQASASGSSEQASSALVFLLVCFLDVCVLSFLILRSDWHGWKLMAAVWLAFYGASFVLPQIEVLVFTMPLPVAMLPRLLLMGFITTALFSPLAVLILGKRKPSASPIETTVKPTITPTRELPWRLAAIAAIYVCVYFTFGYFVAWQNPALRAYYGGTEFGSFFAQMSDIVRNNAGLIAFQVLRGVLWAAIAVPIIRMMKGSRWQVGLAVALLFSVVVSDKLLLANPYMPESVRMTHLVEVATSNFLFGWAVVWMLTKQNSAGIAASAAQS